MKSIYFVLLTCLMFTGCASKGIQTTEVAYKSKTVVVTTPEPLLEPCRASKPPNRETYPTLTSRQKENVLTNYIISLQDDIKACNLQIKKIKDFQAEESLRYKE